MVLIKFGTNQYNSQDILDSIEISKNITGEGRLVVPEGVDSKSALPLMELSMPDSIQKINKIKNGAIWQAKSMGWIGDEYQYLDDKDTSNTIPDDNLETNTNDSKEENSKENNKSNNQNTDKSSNVNKSEDINNNLIEVPKLVGLKLSDARNKIANSNIDINNNDITYLYTGSSQRHEEITEQSIPAGTKSTGGNIKLKVYKYVSDITLEIPFEIICKEFDTNKYKYEEIKFNGNTVEAGYTSNTVISPNPYPVNLSTDKLTDNSINVEVYLDNKLIKSQTFSIGQLEGKEINNFGRIKVNKISMNITQEVK